MGLTLTLDADVANYYCSSTSSSGFKILLHSPIETPKVANFGFYVSPGLETKVVISPKISEASYLIRNVPILQRQCMFANEVNLSFYYIYSRKNCECFP
jgi:acid-sensing ion channel, other